MICGVIIRKLSERKTEPLLLPDNFLYAFPLIYAEIDLLRCCFTMSGLKVITNKFDF